MRTLVLATAIGMSVIGLSIAADSQAAIRRTDIPAQLLRPALQQLSKDRELQLVFRTDVVGDVRTGGAVGDLTTDETLTQLLSGTGLIYRYLDEKTVTIVPRADDAGAVPLPLRAAQTEGDEGKSFWDRFRLAQAPEGNAAVGASQNSADTAPRATQIEEIIVTAQKRQERLVDVPQSVAVLSADELAMSGALQLRDYLAAVPGLNAVTDGSGSVILSMRGVSTGGFDLGPTVAIYVDEVPYGATGGYGSGAFQLDMGLNDIERIEVLRGPQGTLYGASSMGGLIKYLTKKPSLESFASKVMVGTSYTEDGGVNYNLVGVVNAPVVSDKLAVRATAFHSHDDGYIDNVQLDDEDINASERYGGRLDLLALPTEAFTIRMTAFLQDMSIDGKGTADFTLAGRPIDGALDKRRAADEPFDNRFALLGATLTYDWDQFELMSISSYQTTEVQSSTDVSASFVPLLNLFGGPYSVVTTPLEMDTHKFAQEVRLVSKAEAPLRWVLGGFYTRETMDYGLSFSLLDLAGNPAPNPYFNYYTPTEFEELAAFADLTWQITERIDVTAGLRASENQQAFEQFGSGLFVSSIPRRDAKESVTTYLANARYRFDDNSIAYVRYATGYRPGGPNYVVSDPATGAPLGSPTYEADTLKSYEIGYKVEAFDHRFSMDIAAFYIDWSNIQVKARVNNFLSAANAEDGATVRGVELGLGARPFRSLALTVSLAFQDATMNSDDPFLGARANEELPNAPRWSASIDADYTFVESAWRPWLGVSLRHVSDRTTAFDNSPLGNFDLQSYELVDLRAGLTIGKVDLQFNARNLTDERGQLSGGAATIPAPIAIQQPRTLGISATAHF